ncbi:hypothetical protein KY495_13155 [Massilia sp. PAMC28688]|uniref:cupredoxin domain-containing protein n=1 Tax=Massilia sp. PAMC28688 TaxID=2861283 RepID=UPI001C624D6D|nr:hypothetical protein [Massilia sp. PAMC28688]QYF91746.1 hypothetical protein KY495_13155 [Massilia sp. PAMC28688]
MAHPAVAYARRHTLVATITVVTVVVMVYAAMAPIPASSREHVLDITRGAMARRAAGDMTGALPQMVPLTLGVRDVLHIRNNDLVAHFFGALSLAPGEAIKVPFDEAGTQEFASSAHFHGKATVQVDAWPDPGMARLRWRLREWNDAIRRY